MILATKIDKLNVAEGRASVAAIERALAEAFGAASSNVTVIAVSATARRGVAEADEVLRRWFES
jgi:GTP-binding protein EngB required for normal cell division